MFKYISLFVCLLGVSLASSKRSEAENFLEAINKNQQYLGVCEEELGEGFKSCSNLMADLEQLETDGTSAVEAGASIYAQALTLWAKFNKCGTESILKKVACYETVMSSAKTLIASAETEATEVQETLAADVSQLESDLSSCVYSGYTSRIFNTKMAVCKLKMMLKN